MDLRVTAALLLAATPARADRIEHGREEVLAADAVCDAVALSAAIPKLPKKLATTLLWSGLFGQAVAAPTIHALDEDYGRAGISLGVRVGAPVLGLLVGNLICQKTTKHHEIEFLHCFGSAIAGGLVGVVVAQATDALVISRPTKVDAKPIAGFVFRF